MMNDNIFLSILTGIATTASTAAMLFLINIVRNFWLEHEIKGVIPACEPTGMKKPKDNKFIYDVAGVIIKNKLNIPFTIRSILAETESKSGVVLQYYGPAIEKDIFPVGEVHYDNPFGFVTLPPFTNGCWGVESSPDSKRSQVPQKLFCSLRVSVQYLNLFKDPKVIEIVVINKSAFRDLNGLIEEENESLVKSKGEETKKEK